jgi:hypothetical protein
VPILQVFAKPTNHARQDVDAMCRAVASALGLRPEDVVGTHISVADTTIDGTDSSWPVVVLHGSERPPAAMEAAANAVRELARQWGGIDHAGVWVTWQIAA